MKKVRLLFILIVALVAVTIITLIFFLRKQETSQNSIYDSSEFTRSQYINLTPNQDVLLEVITEEPSYSDDTIEYKLINNTNENIYYGTYYEFNIKINDEWFMVPKKKELDWTSIRYELKSMEFKTYTLYLNQYDLPGPGFYRIVKDVEGYPSNYVEFELK